MRIKLSGRNIHNKITLATQVCDGMVWNSILLKHLTSNAQLTFCQTEFAALAPQGRAEDLKGMFD